ncbi:MAG: prephenate dehydrogenase/arogenate dehydrogenase family protein, partial [Peptococcaceae bacterium]|nr:prephenate dehydrogenase/arogenate dehydrogenase family protein [Peptococcaceae bacterium]
RIVSEIKLCLRPDLDFVGGHPLAGREGSGFDQASAEIFQGANYILTPVGARQENVELLVSLVKGIGCKTVIYMDPEEHDRIIALTSHLPHIIAAALMNSNSLARAGKFVGGSFRDATRVADMNVDLWKELLLDNKDNILPQLDIFTENLNKIKRALQEANAGALQELLQQASESRKQL